MNIKVLLPFLLKYFPSCAMNLAFYTYKLNTFDNRISGHSNSKLFVIEQLFRTRMQFLPAISYYLFLHFAFWLLPMI